MRDIMGMMSKARELQEKMQSLQEEIAALTVEGTSGGGMITVTLSGKGEMTALKVDPSLMKPEDREMLEDLIVAAHADAKVKADRVAAEKMQALTGGLGLPAGFKLPF